MGILEKGGRNRNSYCARCKLLSCLYVSNREVHIVRTIGLVLVEGAFLNTLHTVAEIPMKEERNSGGTGIFKFGGEEKGLRSSFFCRNLHATDEEATLLGIVCREDGQCLGEQRSIGGTGMYRDVSLFQRSSEPEIEGRSGCLEECPSVIDVVGEVIIIVGIILRVEINMEGAQVIVQRSKEESGLIWGEDDKAIIPLFRCRADEEFWGRIAWSSRVINIF